jgi:hypothetical protein
MLVCYAFWKSEKIKLVRGGGSDELHILGLAKMEEELILCFRTWEEDKF